MPRMKPLFLDTSGMSMQEMENWGRDLVELQKSLNWYLGDLARAAKASKQLGEDNYSQVFPPDTSPGLIQRCEAVARAYPTEESRNPLATWTIHMQHANDPDRIALVQAHVDAGHTSDEARKADSEQMTHDERPRWLLAVDVNYHLTRVWASGAGIEAAKQVADWIQRTVDRLKEKGLTDCVCCMDSPTSFRKELTKDWEDQYKPRALKDHEHAEQLRLVEDLLRGHGFSCVKLDGFEADDVMATCAAKFDGRVTLLTCDKDMRQALSGTTNMLRDIEWVEDETSGQSKPQYNWITAKDHVEGCTYNNTRVEGIVPGLWTEFQTLAGDGTDGISGASGIGPKIAADLIQWFGSAEGAIQAAKDNDQRLTKAKRQALIEFEAKLEVTRQLVTLVTDLPLPSSTRI